MDSFFKVAILIDGGFFVKNFRHQNNRAPIISDIEPFTNSLINKVQAKTGKHGTDVLFRTYYYDCRPYGSTQKRPDGAVIDFTKKSTFKAVNNFHRDLKTHPQLALRLGALSFDGWKINPGNPIDPPIPDFKQKSVDMKIGLDIAWMASKKTVDKIILVTADSDFISPMKFARKEGLLLYLETMMQPQVKIELKEHADFLL
jgi:uncharacterized LabA/DUF88 family protein